jgi:hypothetical protein
MAVVVVLLDGLWVVLDQGFQAKAMLEVDHHLQHMEQILQVVVVAQVMLGSIAAMELVVMEVQVLHHLFLEQL